MASDHDYWNAMSFNGMAVGALLGSDYTPVISAIKGHALSAGISGNGPSVVAILIQGTSRVWCLLCQVSRARY